MSICCSGVAGDVLSMPPLTDLGNRIVAELQADPQRKNRTIAELLHCGIETVRLYRLRLGIPPANQGGRIAVPLALYNRVGVECGWSKRLMDERMADYRSRVLERRRRERPPYIEPRYRARAARQQALDDRTLTIGMIDLGLDRCTGLTAQEIEQAERQLAEVRPWTAADQERFDREIEKWRREVAEAAARPQKRRRQSHAQKSRD